MATPAPSPAIHVGQIVCRRTEPLDTTSVGTVGGLIFRSDSTLVIVRWNDGPVTFEPEEALRVALRLRRWL
jgi:hypothetical protein